MNFLTQLFTAILLAIKNFLLQTSEEEIRQFHDKALVWQDESSERRRTRLAHRWEAFKARMIVRRKAREARRELRRKKNG